MAEELEIAIGNKERVYKTFVSQVLSLIKDEPNLIANLANITSAYQMTFSKLWVGFYLLENNQLVLGPFQGPIACTRINKGKGVCGLAWEKAQTIIVKNVNYFSGHIACSSASISEIVVPVFDKNNHVFAVLDVDSVTEADFDETDKKYLEQVTHLITKSL
jgi:GAF domain-containing protein